MLHRFPALGQRRTPAGGDNKFKPARLPSDSPGWIQSGRFALESEHNRNAAFPEQNNAHRFGLFVCSIWIFGHERFANALVLLLHDRSRGKQ